jgi:hypothetical protein
MLERKQERGWRCTFFEVGLVELFGHSVRAGEDVLHLV